MKICRVFRWILIVIFLVIIFIIFNRPINKNYNINIIEEMHKKVLIDDFNYHLNDKYWNVVERGNNYNNELQYYRKDNIFINNGILEIEAKKEDFLDYNYTSAMINTKNKFEFLYGKVIFRMKPAFAKGLVSAVWLLPSDDSNFPEIDIVEILGSEINKVWSGIHYSNDEFNKDKLFVDYITGTEFTTYEFNWTNDEITIYENGCLRFQTNENIPNKKMYLVINLSVGGNWAKEPDDNLLPSKMLIDYVIIIPEKSGV